MIRTYRMACCCALTLLLVTPAWSAKPKLVNAPPPPILLDDLSGNSASANAVSSRGQLLYENHCLSCHESVVHVRERRLVKSLAELQAQVTRWSSYQNLRWNKEDIGEVTRYLDERYYRQPDGSAKP